MDFFYNFWVSLGVPGFFFFTKSECAFTDFISAFLPFYRVLPSFSYRVPFHRVLPGFYRVCMRFYGFDIGFSSVLLGLTEFFWLGNGFLPSSIRFYRVWLCFTDLSSPLEIDFYFSFTGFYRVFFLDLVWILRSFIRFYHVLPSFSGSGMDFTEFH